MGSEISSSSNNIQSPEVKRLAPDNMALQSNNVEAAEMKSDKRFRMYAQDFYCPLVGFIFKYSVFIKQNPVQKLRMI